MTEAEKGTETTKGAPEQTMLAQTGAAMRVTEVLAETDGYSA
jgi:hypothetical protein